VPHLAGAPLDLAAWPARRRLTTTPLTMSLAGVTSDRADNYTGSFWDASTGTLNDRLPEVPPDGERRGMSEEEEGEEEGKERR
jgi:hypothetical protein